MVGRFVFAATSMKNWALSFPPVVARKVFVPPIVTWTRLPAVSVNGTQLYVPHPCPASNEKVPRSTVLWLAVPQPLVTRDNVMVAAPGLDMRAQMLNVPVGYVRVKLIHS